MMIRMATICLRECEPGSLCRKVDNPPSQVFIKFSLFSGFCFAVSSEVLYVIETIFGVLEFPNFESRSLTGNRQ